MPNNKIEPRNGDPEFTAAFVSAPQRRDALQPPIGVPRGTKRGSGLRSKPQHWVSRWNGPTIRHETKEGLISGRRGEAILSPASTRRAGVTRVVIHSNVTREGHRPAT